MLFSMRTWISHDDVTNIKLCIYRDTPKSACLSLPGHSQVPHPLCACACVEDIHPTCVWLQWDNTQLYSSDATIEYVLAFPNYPNISCVCVVGSCTNFSVQWCDLPLGSTARKVCYRLFEILSFSQLWEEITVYLLAQYSFEGVLLGCICDVIIKEGCSRFQYMTIQQFQYSTKLDLLCFSLIVCLYFVERDIYFCPLTHNYCVTPKKIHLWLKRENSMLWTGRYQIYRLYL